MRTHRRHEALLCWCDRAALASLVSAQNLAAARLEAAIGRSALLLDLTFTDGERVNVVPSIEIDWIALDQPELSPYIWPAAIASAITAETADEIEAAVLPWIRSLSIAKGFNGETLRVFNPQFGEIAQDARARGFMGAAPYAGVAQNAAPYAYAVRFAGQKRVAVYDPNGTAGASMLARCALSVRCDLGDAAANGAARRWYDFDAFGMVDGTADVAIFGRGVTSGTDAPVVLRLDGDGTLQVPVATPIPTEIMLSFEAEDAPPIGAFGVTCELKRTLRPPYSAQQPPAGGSSGRILLLLRDDWKRNPDADSDDALALSASLSDEGFTVDVCGVSDAWAPENYDLLHAFAAGCTEALPQRLKAVRAAGKPVVLSPALCHPLDEAFWGTGILVSAVRISRDEVVLEDHLQLARRRLLRAEGVPGPGETPAVYGSALREALALADAVVAMGSAEEAVVRQYGYAGHLAYVPAHLRDHEPAAEAAAVVGTGDFILCHAPIHPRCNQLMLMRAAAQAGRPLILAGPVADLEYYRFLREAAGERVIFQPEPDPPLRAALYRSARVFADVAWQRYGYHRIVEAAASGCALVLARGTDAGSLLEPGLWQADPADSEALAVALGDAWRYALEDPARIAACGGRALEACRSNAALVGTVQAYAHAQSRLARA